MAFPAHGEIDIQNDFPLIITTVDGPWNRELVDRWAAEVVPHVEARSGQGGWIGIGVMRRSMLCTSEALVRYREVASQMVQRHGAAAAAHVAGAEVEGVRVMTAVYDDLFGGVLPFRHFECLDKARTWALELLHNR